MRGLRKEILWIAMTMAASGRVDAGLVLFPGGGASEKAIFPVVNVPVPGYAMVLFSGTATETINNANSILFSITGTLTNTGKANITTAAPVPFLQDTYGPFMGAGTLKVTASGTLSSAVNLVGGESFTFSAAANQTPAGAATFDNNAKVTGSFTNNNATVKSVNFGASSPLVVGKYSAPAKGAVGLITASIGFTLGPGESLALPLTISASSVPEPSTLVLLSTTVLCGLGHYVRRRLSAR